MERTPRRTPGKGCLQCQQRRIKCCGKPSPCSNCRIRRLTCRYTHCTSTSHPPSSLSSLAGSWKPDYADALYYFRTAAAADFHGYLITDFWTSMLYQKSEDCVPVRQALVAISSAHRERVTAFGQPLTACTLKLYGKAIRLAVEHMQESTVAEVRATSLYCCAIFYCFELFNKSPQAADIHLDNGLRLLREWHRSSPTWPPLDLQPTLRDHFLKLLYTIGRLDLDRLLRDATAINSEHDDKIFTLGLRISPRPSVDEDDFELNCRMMLLSRRNTRFARLHAYPDTVPISEMPAHVHFKRLELQCQISELEAVFDQREARLHEATAPRASLDQRRQLTALYTFRLYLVTRRVRLDMMLARDPAQRTDVYNKYADAMLKYAKTARDYFGVQGERVPLLPEPGVLLPIQWLAHSVSREDSRREALEFVDQYCAIEGVSVFEPNGHVTAGTRNR